MCLKLAYRHPASLRGLSTKAPTSVRSVCLIFCACVFLCLFLLSSQFGGPFRPLNYNSGRTSSLPQEDRPGRQFVFNCFPGLALAQRSHSEPLSPTDTHTIDPLLQTPPLHLKQETRVLCLAKRRLLPWIKVILESKAAWLWKSIIPFCHGNSSCPAPEKKSRTLHLDAVYFLKMHYACLSAAFEALLKADNLNWARDLVKNHPKFESLKEIGQIYK